MSNFEWDTDWFSFYEKINMLIILKKNNKKNNSPWSWRYTNFCYIGGTLEDLNGRTRTKSNFLI